MEVKKAMLDAYPTLRSMYNENDGNTAVYYLKDAKATISSLGEYTSKSLWPHNALALLCEGTLRGQPPNLKVEPGAGDFGCDRQARP